MRTYTIHEAPDPVADRIDRAEALVFVKDGFSWPAAVFGPLWLLVNRLWWPLLGYAAVSIALQFPEFLLSFDQRWPALAGLALNLLLGFEADTLRRWTLERRGWQTIGTVSGKTKDECERRFFDAWLPTQPILTAREQSRFADEGRWSLGRLLGARS